VEGSQNRSERLRDAVAANPAWYHTIELAPGVTTPGVVDLRRVAAKALPDRMDGLRALDVGTFDGFWAFEMERRGADVVAIDVGKVDAVQLPPVNRERLTRAADQIGLELGTGFALAAEALGSKARRIECSVLDLEPTAIDGPVDFVFVGALLLHLRDPVQALERILKSLNAGGRLTYMEPASILLTMLSPRRPVARFQPLETNFNWWVNNLAGLRALAVVAGFQQVERIGLVRPPSVKHMRQVYAIYRGRRPSTGRDNEAGDPEDG
jgi:tRNA (mo5U34)-methyltransferase